MITIEEDFLRQLMTPLPLTDDRGRVFMINDAAAMMLRSAGCRSILSMTEIDPLFGKEDQAGFLKGSRNIQVGKVFRRTGVFTGSLVANEQFYLYQG